MAWNGIAGNTTITGTYIPSIEKPMPGCERKNVTFCTTSQDELFKCLDMQKVAYSRRIRPDVRCVKPEGESKEACINEVAARRADVVTLNPNDLYTASRWVMRHPLVNLSSSSSPNQRLLFITTSLESLLDNGSNDIRSFSPLLNYTPVWREELKQRDIDGGHMNYTHYQSSCRCPICILMSSLYLFQSLPHQYLFIENSI